MDYVTDGAWGTGLGRVLQPAEIDGNFWELKNSLNNLIANPQKPLSIVSITSPVPGQMVFNMSDGSTIGPVYFPLAVFTWRGNWAANLAYRQFDVFQQPGVGLYFVAQNFTSGATFDSSIQVNGSPAMIQMFAYATQPNLVYDMGFFYQGVIGNSPEDRLWQMPMVREIVLPAAGSHEANLRLAASTSAQTLPVYQDATQIGQITFSVGANAGTVTINADATFQSGDVLGVGKPTVADAVAAELSVVFAAQQVAT